MWGKGRYQRGGGVTGAGRSEVGAGEQRKYGSVGRRCSGVNDRLYRAGGGRGGSISVRTTPVMGGAAVWSRVKVYVSIQHGCRGF